MLAYIYQHHGSYGYIHYKQIIIPLYIYPIILSLYCLQQIQLYSSIITRATPDIISQVSHKSTHGFTMKKTRLPVAQWPSAAQDLSQGCASAKSGAEVARRLANGVKVNVEDAWPKRGEKVGKTWDKCGKSMEHMGKLWETYENYGKNMGNL
jgi:hypothetical protein